MSLAQCNRCLYRDTLRPQPGGSVFCLVRESLVMTRDDCPDFAEREDGIMKNPFEHEKGGEKQTVDIVQCI